jgi:hypothetical protein
MTDARKYIMIVVAVVAILALAGCSREITTVQQVTPSASSCFDCHSDQDPFLVSINFAWSNSWHASGRVVARSTSASCAPCHSTEGFIQVAAGEEVVGVDNPTVIHCFACHQPHSEGDFGLRKDDPTAIQDGTVYDIGAGNLCVNCHQGRRNVNDYVFDGVTLSRYFGPHHGPQSDMLFGSNGYEYAGYTYTEKPFHRSLTEDGCVDCHLKYSNTYAVGGHSFNMRSQDEEEGDEILNLGSCTGCHGELDDFNYNMIQTEVDSMATLLNGLLQTAGLMDATGHAQGGVTTSADSAGAVYNYLVVHEDRSLGVHNSDYAKSLLDSAIKFINGELVPGK